MSWNRCKNKVCLVKLCYSQIKHSSWMFQVTPSCLTHESALGMSPNHCYMTQNFVYDIGSRTAQVFGLMQIAPNYWICLLLQVNPPQFPWTCFALDKTSWNLIIKWNSEKLNVPWNKKPATTSLFYSVMKW